MSKEKISSGINKPSATNKKLQWLPLGIILLVATALYLYQLGTESFWVDELYSVNDAKAIPERIGLIRPVYYVLLYFWMFLGSSDAWLRSLSVIFALVSIVLIYLLGRKVAGEGVGLIAALLLTLSPLYINFAQMVRMYSLGTALALGGTLALVYTLEKPTNLSFGCWAVSRWLMIITAPLNGALIVPDILLLVWKLRQHRRGRFLFGKWLLILLILWSPFLAILVSKAMPFLTNAFDVTAKVSSSPSTSVRHSFPTILDVVRKLRNFSAFPFPSTSRLMSWFYQGYTLMSVGLLSLALVRKHRSGKLIWIAISAFLPALMIFFVSKRLWIDRYMLFLCPYILILLAAGFMRVWRMQRFVAIGVALVYFLAVSGGIVRYYSVLDRQDWRGIAQEITTQEQPGDAIVLSGGSPSMKMTTALAHYYSGSAPVSVNPKLCTNNNITAADFEAALESLPTQSSRLWILCSEDFAPETFNQFFGEKFQLQSHQEFRNENFYREDDWLHLFLATPSIANPS